MYIICLCQRSLKWCVWELICEQIKSCRIGMKRICTFFNPGMIVDNSKNCCLSRSRRFLSAMTWSWAQEGGLLPMLILSGLWKSRVFSLHVEPRGIKLLITFVGSTTPFAEFTHSCGGSCNESWLSNERKLEDAWGSSTETSPPVTATMGLPKETSANEQLALLKSLLLDDSKGRQEA